MLPFQVVPDAQLAVATLVSRSTPLLYRKKLRPACGTLAEVVPLLPEPTGVFALGVFDVTADVPTGLVVVHVRLTLQVLAPAPMVHEGAAGVSVPDIGA